MSEQSVAMSGIAQAVAPREVLAVGNLQGILTESIGVLRTSLHDLAGKVGPVLDQREATEKSLTAPDPYTSNNPVGLCVISQIEEVRALTDFVRTLERRAEL